MRVLLFYFYITGCFQQNNKEDITELNKVLLDSEVGKYRKCLDQN